MERECGVPCFAASTSSLYRLAATAEIVLQISYLNILITKHSLIADLGANVDRTAVRGRSPCLCFSPFVCPRVYFYLE